MALGNRCRTNRGAVRILAKPATARRCGNADLLSFIKA
jgi:hypothetical protein